MADCWRVCKQIVSCRQKLAWKNKIKMRLVIFPQSLTRVRRRRAVRLATTSARRRFVYELRLIVVAAIMRQPALGWSSARARAVAARRRRSSPSMSRSPSSWSSTRRVVTRRRRSRHLLGNSLARLLARLLACWLARLLACRPALADCRRRCSTARSIERNCKAKAASGGA